MRQHVCPYCDVVEEHANTLHYHIKREHEKNFDHCCKYCDYKTYGKSQLEQHMKHNHVDKMSAVKLFACPFCEIKSTSKGNLKTHIARTHAHWVPEFKTGKACCGCGSQQKSATAYYYHCITCIVPPINEAANYQKIEQAIK